MTRKKPAKKKAKKKTSKIIVDELPAEPVMKTRILAVIEITPAIEELLKSNEAKLYLTGIDRAFGKLQAMIRRETVLAQHPGHAGP